MGTLLKIILGAAVFVGVIFTLSFLLGWYVDSFGNIYPALNLFAEIAICLIVLCSLVAIAPKTRAATGLTIELCSGALVLYLWLTNLYVSATTLGTFWTIFGAAFAGAGVFVTAGVGMLLNGAFGSLFLMLIWLAVAFGVRMWGMFVVHMHPGPRERNVLEPLPQSDLFRPISVIDSSEDGEGGINRLVTDYGIDEDTAEQAQGLMYEGMDEGDAVQAAEEGEL